MTIQSSRLLPGSIRNRILIFSILVTLVPSIGMGWFWYDISRKTTTAKVQQKFFTSADIVEREIGLWFKERNYDLRVFSNSFVVAENLSIYQQHLQKSSEPSKTAEAALRKISIYLSIIIRNFSAYHRLSVLDSEGRVLAASSPVEQEKFVAIPEGWKQQVSRNNFFVGDYFFTDGEGAPLALVGIPLFSNEKDTIIGYFILHVHLDSIRSILDSSLPDREATSGCKMTLLEKSGRIIFTTAPVATSEKPAVVSAEVQELFNQPRGLYEYTDDNQVQVMGIAFSFKELPWSILIAESKEDIYAGLLEARDRILLLAALLTVVIGGAAIKVSRQIIIPLKALTTGVLEVANGDLEVSVPVRRKDELGLVTEMFNEMVIRLRDSQSKLEELATTDSLTGLANRKQIMANLDLQLEGYRRNGTDFAVLMLDIDFFKKVNDTYGHQAGDSVLTEMASILHNILRTRDTAGRYGGEEFIVILDTTDLNKAVQTAERIRHAVEHHPFIWQDQVLRVTVSIGVTAITVDDKSLSNMISRVDKALYKAKKEGRNRVISDTLLSLPLLNDPTIQ